MQKSSSSSLPPFLQSNPPPTQIPSFARLEALYASTSSQRQSNPTGYDINAQWWASTVESTLLSGWLNGEDGDRLILRVDDGLLGKLENGEGARPRGIGGVVEQLATTSPPTFHPLPHFLASTAPLHAPPSLTYRFVGRPLWWVLAQLNPFAPSTERVEKEGTLWKRYGKGREYVHMPLLERAAAVFTAHLADNPVLSYSTSLHSLASFQDEFAEVCFPSKDGDKQRAKGEQLGKRDVEVLVTWLSRDCGALVTDGEVIKLLEPGQSATDHPITEADRGTLAIVQTLRRIEGQVENIEAQINHCQIKVKSALANNQKTLATSYLRSKRGLEDVLSKRVASSEQLSSVIRGIDQAKGDVEVMAAYETATSTLNTILKNPLLDLERVNKTTDELAEAMASQEEVDTAIRSVNGVAGAEIDEDELEGELNQLVAEEKKAQAEAEVRAEEARIRVDRDAEQKRLREEKREREEKERLEAEKRKIQVEAMARAKEEDSREFETQQWDERYEAARQREQEEKVRAEAERLRKEEARITAD